MLKDNFILGQDSYKAGHFLQYPQGTKYVQSVITPRKGNKFTKEIVVGGTAYAAAVLSAVRITQEDVDEAARECAAQGLPFNRKGWESIVSKHFGKLPLSIRAIPEGTVVKPNTAIVTVENTCPEAYWLPSYIETMLQRIIWKASTVATKSRHAYKILAETAAITTEFYDSASAVEYRLHNFGDRGADGQDAAVIAGISHALLFSGSDCLQANRVINHIYKNEHPVLSSVEASEHSTMCTNSNMAVRDDYDAAVMAVERLEAAVARANAGVGIPVFSVVIDTYDSHRFVGYLGSQPLLDRILKSGGTMVLRPDSGDPLVEPFTILDLAKKHFGSTVNKKGFKVLNPAVRVIQGDGINTESLQQILNKLVNRGWSLENILFGMGGGLTHDGGRDEFSFAMKTTAFSKDGKIWTPVKKDPITDPGKASLSGYIVNYYRKGEIQSVDITKGVPFAAVVDVHIYENGNRYAYPFSEARNRARKGI